MTPTVPLKKLLERYYPPLPSPPQENKNAQLYLCKL